VNGISSVYFEVVNFGLRLQTRESTVIIFKDSVRTTQ